MARVGPVSGAALLAVAAGSVVMWSALKNASIEDTLRALLRGQPIPSGASLLDQDRAATATTLGRALKRSTPDTTNSTGTLGGLGGAVAGVLLGPRIAAAAAQHLGKPYRFGTAGPSTFDCSGLVTYVLRECGVTGLPSMSHTVTAQFYVWSGAVTVPRPPRAGDLICWTGHIGIAVSDTEMIHAPGTGQQVKRTRIYYTPTPLVRRVRGA